MNKQTLLVVLSAAFALCACQSSKVRIAGRFVGNNARYVYLEQVSPLAQKVVDSVELDKNGNYRFMLKDASRTPSLYNLIFNGERIPLFLAGGDRVTVNSVGSVIRNYTVAGSRESELLREFYQAYVGVSRRLEQIVSRYADAEISAEQRQRLAREYTDEYYRIRREQLRFIIGNKASTPAGRHGAFQRRQRRGLFPHGGRGARTDLSRFALSARPAGRDRTHGRADQPHVAHQRVGLSGPGADRYLRQEDPPVVARGEGRHSTVMNAELKDIYAKYAGSPTEFEVYQVAIDSSKPLWITAVQEQQLPWVSVSDLKGRLSPVVGLYNVQKLPANFLIDREGTIVAKDIYGKSLDDKLAELTR